MSAHLHGSGTVYQDGTMKKQRTLLVLSAAILVGGVGTALALQSKTEFTVARPIVQPKTVEQVAMRMLARRGSWHHRGRQVPGTDRTLDLGQARRGDGQGCTRRQPGQHLSLAESMTWNRRA